MIWPWQYKKKVKEYEARIAELKLAGWMATSAWYRATGLLSYEDYKKVSKDYNWHRENGVFAFDKKIDGPSPDYISYYKSGQQPAEEVSADKIMGETK